MKAHFATALVFASFLIPFIAPSAQAQQVDVTALVRQSVQNYERDWREAMTWSYRQTDVNKSDDTTEVEVSEIVPIDGTPYERLLIKGGQKLSPDEEKKEEHKYEKALKQRGEETPEERQERIQKYEAERAFLKDIPDAYIFRLAGETVIDGRPAWIVKLSPKPGFISTTSHGNMLEHISGTIWIDKQDLQWPRAEAEVTGTIEIGWILARVGRGAHFVVEQTRVADGLWMPLRITITGVARVLLVHNKVIDEELTFSGFHKAASGTVANAVPPAKVTPHQADKQAGSSFR